MKRELTEKLHTKYPAIFHPEPDYYIGLDCGEGWFEIIDELCSEIMQSCGDNIPIATQVKEKFGRLCFYYTVNSKDKAITEVISKAEQKSETICEVCGAKGTLRDKKTWVKTLCDKDAQKLGYTDVVEEVENEGQAKRLV